MALLKNGIDLADVLKEFISNSKHLTIFVPYIKLESLKQLLGSTTVCNAIVVRWESKDLILGSSDLEVYQYCKQRKIALYRNPRLHLKAFVDEQKRCIMGSPNISSRALNLPEVTRYNYELATTIEDFTIDDRLYFNMIVNESTLIDDSVYNQLKAQLLEYKNVFSAEPEFNFKIKTSDKDFLTSSLPMSYSVNTLFEIYEKKDSESEEELNCAIHDLALYNIPLGLTPTELSEMLKSAFFNHPFIKAFLFHLETNREIYFGSARIWIQKNCTEVPIPRRSEITENIQILYRWVVDLGEGKYKVDVPGSYSERLSLA